MTRAEGKMTGTDRIATRAYRAFAKAHQDLSSPASVRGSAAAAIEAATRADPANEPARQMERLGYLLGLS